MNGKNIGLRQKIDPEPPKERNQRPLIKIAAVFLILSFVVSAVILAFQNNRLRRQLQPEPSQLPISSVQVFQETRKEISDKKWLSPSGKKYITYIYSSYFDEFGLHLFNEDRELNIGRKNEPVANLEVTWSPDETYAAISNSNDLTRIFCVNTDNQECTGEVVFYVLGGASLYWSDNQTVYISFTYNGNNVISKLAFPSDTIYPKEHIIYEKPWNAFFAYRPVSISPNNFYLVMESRYEGPPVLAIMNTQTGKIIEPRKNGELYVLGSKPNYTWNGNLLTFTGGLTVNSSWLELADETHTIDDNLLEEINIDVSVLK